MIWMLYYVTGFWLTFGLIVLYSVQAQDRPGDIETGEESPAIFAALVLAVTWPVGLPTFAAMKVNNYLHRDDSQGKNKRTNGHGYHAS